MATVPEVLETLRDGLTCMENEWATFTYDPYEDTRPARKFLDELERLYGLYPPEAAV